MDSLAFLTGFVHGNTRRSVIVASNTFVSTRTKATTKKSKLTGAAAAPVRKSMSVREEPTDCGEMEVENAKKRREVEREKEEKARETEMEGAVGGREADVEDMLTAMFSIAPHLSTYHSRLENCISRLDESGVESCIEEMEKRRVAWTSTTYTIVLSAYIEQENETAVKKLFAKMLTEKEMTLGFVADKLVRFWYMRNNFNQVLVVANGVESSDVAYTQEGFEAILHASGRIEGGMAAREKMLQSKDILFNVRCYAAVMKALAHDGNVKEIMKIFLEMDEKNIEPNMWLFNGVMRQLSIRGDEASLEKILAVMDKKGVRRETPTYNALLKTHSRNGRVTDVKKVWRKMKREHVTMNRFTYETLIETFARAGDLTAEKLCDQMMVTFPNHPPEVKTFQSLLRMHLRRNDLRAAENVLMRMEKTGVEPPIAMYNTLKNQRKQLRSARKQ